VSPSPEEFWARIADSFSLAKTLEKCLKNGIFKDPRCEVLSMGTEYHREYF